MRVRTVVPAIALLGVLAACGGETAPANDEAVEADVTVMGTDSLAYEPSEVAVDSGATLALSCGEAVNHTFVVEQGGQQLAACDPGGVDTATVDLDPGEYVFYCDVPGHREAGMEGTLSVE